MSIKGIQATRDLIDAGNALKDRNDPLNAVEFLRGLTYASSRVLPPQVGIVVRELAKTWAGDLRATGEKIRDAHQRIEAAAKADGLPGFPPADPTPPGMEWQPTIIVSDDGTSFSQGPSRLVPEGTKSSRNEYYDPAGNRIYPPDGGWANPKDPLKPWNDTPPEGGSPEIDPETNSSFEDASRWRPRFGDPLALDLDGDGIETISADQSVLFDHDADGTKHGSGWLNRDDGFLVLDKNGNGFIDNGTELFGVDYLKQNGSKATDGFDALRDLDANSDGVFDINDAEFANVRVWRDLNQDGISQTTELKTLADSGIASIGLNAVAASTNLWNGNRLTHTALYTKTDGSTGTAANLVPDANPFFRKFGDSIPLTEEAKTLPNMRGSGTVRDLREAVSLSPALGSALAAYAAAPIKAAQLSLLDSVVQAWAASSPFKTSVEQAASQGLTLVYLAPGQTITDYEAANGIGTAGSNFHLLSVDQQTRILDLEAERQALVERISLLETFNGQPFVDVTPDNRVLTGSGAAVSVIAATVPAGGGADVIRNFAHVSINAAQIGLLDQSYAALKQSTYDTLVTQTRLKPYLEAINLTFTSAGDLALDFGGLETRYEAHKVTDPRNALIDLIELQRYTGPALAGMGFNIAEIGLADMTAWRNDVEIKALLRAANVSFDDSSYGYMGDGYFTDDTLIAREAGSILSASGGNDALFGRAGPDNLYGGLGDDRIYGGAGNDILAGWAGSDTYVFHRGFGQDQINNTHWDGRFDARNDVDRIQFTGDIRPDEVRLERVSSESGDPQFSDLHISVGDDRINVRGFFAEDGEDPHRIDEIRFADGTVWKESDIFLKALESTAGDDRRVGYATGDVIDGGAGNDWLEGRGGDDTLSGGVGNDTLDGGTGDDILDGGVGDDVLSGGAGDDTYQFGRGYERDVAVEEASPATQGNRVVFNADVTPADVVVRKVGNDLTLGIKGTTDLLTLRNAALYAEGSAFGSVEFSDGTTWNHEALKSLAIVGTDGNDHIEGFDGRAEIFDGGAGDDVIEGGTGGDIYRFGRGDGQDVVRDSDGYSGNIDTLEFKVGVLPSDVLLTRDGQDLVARIADTGDQTTLKGWFDPYSSTLIERIRFADGTSWDVTTVLALVGVTPGEAYLFGTPGPDTLNGGAANNFIFGQEGDDLLSGGDGNDTLEGGDGNDMLLGGDGMDTLNGGLGLDHLNSGAGDDTLHAGGDLGNTYVIEQGGGFDTIKVAPVWSGVGEDVLRFGPGITSANLKVQITELNDGGYGGGEDGGYGGVAAFAFIGEDGIDRGPIFSNRLALAIGTGTNEGALLEMYGDGGIYTPIDFGVRRFVFDDGTELTLNDILALADGGVIGEQSGTEGDDSWLFGSVANDTIRGLGGNDRIEARDNEDVVFGGGGDDVISAGPGDDQVYGEAGDDVIAGGLGNDTLDGGAGLDVYVFNRGDGHDRLAAQAEDTLSFGVDILPGDVFAYRNPNGDLVLRLNDGTDGTLTIDSGALSLPTQRVQFINADGEARVFDLAGALTEHSGLLGVSDAQNPVRLLTNAAHEITGSITVAGGDYAVAYAQTGDLFGTPYYATLRFGVGVSPASIRLSYENGGFLLNYGVSGESMRFASASGTEPFASLVFEDGSSLSFAALTAGGLDIIGTPDVDSLTGTGGSDRINGLAGNDILSGGGGFDTYSVAADGGVDTIIDQATPGEENLLIFSGPVFNLDQIRLVTNGQPGFLSVEVAGETRAVKLSGFDPAHALTPSAIGFFQLGDGGPVHSYAELAAMGFNVAGTGEDDVLQGTAVFDHISGGAGNDHLQSGPGDDIAEGGAGYDHYYYNRGDGLLTIRDEISSAPGNALHFGSGITIDDIRNNLRFEAPAYGSPGTLIINVDADGNGIRIEGFDQGNAETGAHAVENFVFADGSVLSYAELVRNTFVIQGDGATNVLTGTNISDRLYGFGAADTLMGGAGSDTLTGGEGADLLQGGDGDDVYVFNRGDGMDTILDSGADNLNSILFGPGILLGDVSYDWEGSTLVLNYGPGDSVRIPDFYLTGDYSSPVVRLIEFDDGMVLSMADLLNRAPLVGDAISAPAAIEDSEYLFTVPAGAFTDPDAGDRLSLIAQLADGSPLPTWLTFNPSTGVFSGTPKNAHVSSLDIKLEAKDYFRLSAAQTFRIEVLNVNDAPIVGGTPLPALTLLEDETFSYTLPENTFLDVDAGDSLSYSATLTDGSALPSWLSFDATTRTFSGIPANGDVGSLAISVTATDLVGASVATAFDLSVLNVNDAPVVSTPIVDQSAKQGQAYLYTLPANTFTDPDVGDSLSYEVSLENGDPLPAWLSFDATTLTFSGTPGGGDVGNFGVKVTASDQAGAQVADSFTFSVSPGYNEINGTAGWDFLIGTPGNDRIDGKANADFMAGLGGDDLYIVDSWDFVLEFAGGGVDTVEASVSYQLPWHVENLSLTGSGAINGTGNFMNNVLIGNSAANTLTGLGGDDILIGGKGNDRLIGGTGNDLYLFGRGDGADTIVDYDRTSGNSDTLRFGADISAEQLWFSRTGNDLSVSVIGSQDTVSISNWYLGTANHVERIEAGNGQVVLDSQVQNLVNAMAAFAPPAAGQTALPTDYQASLAPVIAANWQ